VATQLPRSITQNWIFIATEDDQEWMASIRKEYPKAKFFSTEYLLTGILRQELEPERFISF